MADTTNNGDPAAAQAADQQQAALLQQQQTQIEKKAIEAAQMQAQALASAQEVAKVAAAAGVNIDTAGLITDFNQHINKEQPIAEKSNVPSCHSYSEEPRMKSYQIFRRRLSRIDIAISVYCSSNFMTFSSSNAKEEISTIVTANESEQSTSQPKATRHVFQALQYLLKLCSHPVLVIGESPPDYLVDHLKDIGMGSGDELHDLHHSPKLVALQEILHECGIGCEISSPDASAAVGQHRVLIFAQHKAFLDIIEKDLFQSHMRSVTYLRLDGSVQTEKRFEIVKSFNSDPTIDVLLLTTHVGGLGLNLTSADTLVFMEHDWNPMKDLQAMDRAHRLGQKKVVNVHRLIMRGTLEEKVMSLQRFKVSVANAVINAENASLKTMNTDQLLDLFTSTPASRKASVLPSSSSGEESKESKGKSGRKGLKSILSGLDELWDQSQYADEYHLNQFLAKLNGFVHALDERERLLVTTEWLVKYIARTYTGMGTAFEDLLQAGTMGVLDGGAERFDSEKGCKFSTYVKYWIRKAMLALLAEDSGVIQLPARMESIIRKMKEAKRVIRSSMGKNPIDAEIATFIGVSVSNIRLARKCSRRVVSLYAEVGTGQNAKFMEVTPDTSLEAPDEAIFRRQMKERLLLVLDKLPAREGRVLKLRHGLKDGKCRSLEQIGGIYHVSKEWIRKIEMSKLRNEDVHHELKDFCGF